MAPGAERAPSFLPTPWGAPCHLRDAASPRRDAGLSAQFARGASSLRPSGRTLPGLPASPPRSLSPTNHTSPAAPGAPVLPFRAPDRGVQFRAHPRSHPVRAEEKSIFREVPLSSEKFSVQKGRSLELTGNREGRGARAEQESPRSPGRRSGK